MKSLRGILRRVGKQPLPLVIIAVILVGAIGAVNSYSAPTVQSALAGSKKTGQTTVLGVNSGKSTGANSLQTNQNTPNQSSNSNGQGVQNPVPPNPQPNPLPTPQPKPPIIIPTPLPTPTPPQPCKYPLGAYQPDCTQPPCYVCSPGHACPETQKNSIAYPCSPCGGPIQADYVCRVPQAQ